MIKISVKDYPYRTSNNIICFKDLETGKMGEAQYLYIDKSSEIIYRVDEKVANYKIVWVLTDGIVSIQDDLVIKENDMDKSTIIHINRNIIQQNAKHGRDEPVCRVEKDGKVRYCMEVRINGPSHMIYRPNKPRPCGAKLWIETFADVELIGEKL